MKMEEQRDKDVWSIKMPTHHYKWLGIYRMNDCLLPPTAILPLTRGKVSAKLHFKEGWTRVMSSCSGDIDYQGLFS